MSDDYERIFTSTPLSTALVCPRCGALVAPQRANAHDEWHALVTNGESEGDNR